MKSELIKKAYEFFGGVWPDDGWHTPILENRRLAICVKDTAASSIGEIKQVSSFCSLKVYAIICTKEEFEQYGESLKLTPEEIEADCGIDDEWMPEVGKECEYSHSGLVYHKCLVMGFFEDLIWLNHHNYDNDGLFSGSPITHDISSLSFRPLKTERAKLFDECVEAIYNIPQCSAVTAGHMDAIEWLIDLGYIHASTTK